MHVLMSNTTRKIINGPCPPIGHIALCGLLNEILLLVASRRWGDTVRSVHPSLSASVA